MPANSMHNKKNNTWASLDYAILIVKGVLTVFAKEHLVAITAIN